MCPVIDYQILILTHKKGPDKNGTFFIFKLLRIKTHKLKDLKTFNQRVFDSIFIARARNCILPEIIAD